LERAARRFGVERTRRDSASGEIVEKRARDGRFADPTLVRANQNDDRLSHSLLPQNATELETTRGYQHPLHGRTKTWQNESKDMKSISRMRTSGVTSPSAREKLRATVFYYRCGTRDRSGGAAGHFSIRHLTRCGPA